MIANMLPRLVLSTAVAPRSTRASLVLPLVSRNQSLIRHDVGHPSNPGIRALSSRVNGSHNRITPRTEFEKAVHDPYSFGDETRWHHKPWTEKLPDRVPNTGSVARDHLANERTFLSWARTGIAFVALGIGIDSMQRMTHPSYTAPAASSGTNTSTSRIAALASHPHTPSFICIMTGASFLAYAAGRYYRVQHELLRGSFPVNRIGVFGVLAGSSMMTLAGLSLVFAKPEDLSIFATGPVSDTESEKKCEAEPAAE